MTLKEILRKWNEGFEYGSQVRLAKELKVSEATVARWIAGKLRPSEKKIKEMSKIFNIPVEQISSLFHEDGKQVQNVGRDNNDTMQQVGNIFEIQNIKSLEIKVEQISKDIQILNLKLDLILEKLKN